jgi:hypothetical protein
VDSIWQCLGPPPEKTLHEEWDSCRRSCHRVQKTLNEALNSCCAAFQGIGDTALAIDVVRVSALLSNGALYTDIPVQTVNSVFSPGNPINTDMKEMAALTRTMSLKGRLHHTIVHIKDGENALASLLAPDEDMAKAAKELKLLITKAQADGMSWPSAVTMGADQLQVLVTDLANADLGSLRKKLSEIVKHFTEGDCQHVAYAIGLLDHSHFHSVVFAAKQINLFLSEMEKKLDEMTNLAAQNDPKPVAEKIGSLLGEIEETVKQVQEAQHDTP